MVDLFVDAGRRRRLAWVDDRHAEPALVVYCGSVSEWLHINACNATGIFRAAAECGVGEREEEVPIGLIPNEKMTRIEGSRSAPRLGKAAEETRLGGVIGDATSAHPFVVSSGG
jgi:hypothetical protein